MDIDSQAELDASWADFDGGSQEDVYSDNAQSSSGISENDRQESSSDNLEPNDREIPRKSLKAFADERWKQIRKHYNDQYVELFRQTFSHDNDNDGVEIVTLPSTQLGTVSWRSVEKQRLYNALSRKGRLNISGLAGAIGTKSELEAQDYISFIRKQEGEMHLFARHVGSITQADIPAAVEISRECEDALEKAADALAAYQDQYDDAVGKTNLDSTWIIDREVAEGLDVRADKEEELLEAGEGGTDMNDSRLFRLSALVDLSERIYMNPSGEKANTWRDIATGDERPALTHAVITDLHILVLSLARRLIQSALFVAQSRIRASQTQGYSASSVVKEKDVVAALDVLGLPINWWDYWTGVARRNHLRVIAGSHRKGSTTKKCLNYDIVEALLKIKSHREYHSSRSRSIDASSGDDFEAALDEALSKSERVVPPPQAFGGTSPSVSGEDGGVPSSKSTSSEDGSQADTDISEELAFTTSTSKQRGRQIVFDYEQDEYLEEFDRFASRQEEARLWQKLGREARAVVKDELEDEEARSRVKVLRKARDDLRDWTSTTYEAEWEHFGAVVPAERFAETERDRKKRKLGESVQRPNKRQVLPLR